jgi:hypothetical protein
LPTLGPVESQVGGVPATDINDANQIDESPELRALA